MQFWGDETYVFYKSLFFHANPDFLTRIGGRLVRPWALLTIASWATPKSWWSVRPISRLFRKKPAGPRPFETHHFTAKIWGKPPRKDFRALEPSISPLFDAFKDPSTGAIYFLDLPNFRKYRSSRILLILRT